MPSGFVYILTNQRNGTLYIGVTSNLLHRMEQHRLGKGSKFVEKYGLNRLVWFEEYPLYADAIQWETSLKRWKRQWETGTDRKGQSAVEGFAGNMEHVTLGGRVKPGHGEEGT